VLDRAGLRLSFLSGADLVFVYARSDLSWDAHGALAPLGQRVHVHDDLSALVADVAAEAQPGDAVVVVSNGDFGGVHNKLLTALRYRRDHRRRRGHARTTGCA